MKKILLLLAGLVFFAGAANAQVDDNASQTVELNLTDIIEITLTNPTVSLSFTTAANYTSGVESGAEIVTVNSNKDYMVEMKAGAANFSDGTNNIPIAAGVFMMKVAQAPSLGGTITGTFAGYTQVTITDQTIINPATKGAGSEFQVQYKVTPGLTYPGGTPYTNTVVYTATQL